MLKFDLLCHEDSIIRVLEIQEQRVLVIDCLKRTMPVWVDRNAIKCYSVCPVAKLFDATDFTPPAVDSLDMEQKKIMHQRYSVISPVLPFIADEKQRSKSICRVAEEHQLSKQAVRGYLCQYLSYLDLTALAPRKREKKETLSTDQKNMRWALNKFFYTRKKNSLMTAYTMMLKEKYSTPFGELFESYVVRRLKNIPNLRNNTGQERLYGRLII